MSRFLSGLLPWLETLIATRRHAAGCLLLALIMLPFLLTLWGMQTWALLSPAAGQFYRPELLVPMQGLLTAAILFTAWVIVFSWPRYRSEDRRPLLVTMTTVVLGMIFVMQAIGYGLKDSVMGLMLLSLLIMARTLFTAAELMPAMAAAAVVLVVNEMLLLGHGISYAPLLSAPIFDGGPLAWWWALWMRVNFATAIVFFCAMLFFLLWAKERRQARLEDMARIDALTGVLSRAAFMRRLEEECKHLQRTRRPACLMLCDVDQFRTVNERWGEATGNRVLRQLGTLLKTVTRWPVDAPARYDGEAFAILLPETDLAAAQRLAERIDEQLRGLVLDIDGQRLAITLSIGIAQFDDGDADKVLRVADENLHRATRAGGARVEASAAN